METNGGIMVGIMHNLIVFDMLLYGHVKADYMKEIWLCICEQGYNI